LLSAKYQKYGKKNGCPENLPGSQSLLYDHNSILKRSCACLMAQLSDQRKMFENLIETII